ncbi:hypothetical protein [Desertivirga xinjiangensis]|uniref:hypothetical protein n=1 Tax=Desertivirga xinjiangensis TaxID=539206 RepID=UPI00210BB926|nr:hypothetical protein [Pedobacter xinjiangensis]
MKKINMNVLALVLGLTFAISTAATVRDSDQWVYNPALGSETDADSYVAGTVGSCATGSNICGIVAEEDPLNMGHPQFSEGQQSRIENRETNQADVFLKN